MRKIIPKILISIFSTIFFLALLEAGLRVAGFFYLKKTISGTAPSMHGGEMPVKILSVGDSYTVGGALEWNDTYPAQLQAMLSRGLNRGFEVINGGICEANSTQVSQRLSELVRIYGPDYVILLAGSANRFNLIGYDSYQKKKKIIPDLRILKLAKIFTVNLKGRILEWKTSRRILPPRREGNYFELDDDIDYQQAEARYQKAVEANPRDYRAYLGLGYSYLKQRKFKEAEQLYKKAIEIDPGMNQAYTDLGSCYRQEGRFKEAEELYKKAIGLNPKQVRAYTGLGKIYIHQGRCASALEFLLKAVELDPEDFPYYYYLSMAYQLQSKYDADYILQTFQRIIEDRPALIKNKIFTDYLAFFKDKEKWEGRINKWLEQDLEKMAWLCRENKIRLIIQNYPYPYFSANEALRDLALNRSLPFVDNYSVFDELTAKEGGERYFLDYDHCTAEGNRVIAENIYRALVSDRAFLKNIKANGAK